MIKTKIVNDSTKLNDTLHKIQEFGHIVNSVAPFHNGIHSTRFLIVYEVSREEESYKNRLDQLMNGYDEVYDGELENIKEILKVREI